MRILMTADTVGGVWTYTREVAAGLLASGCDLSLVTLGQWPSSEQNVWLDGIRDQYPDTFRSLATDYPLEWMQDNSRCYEDSRQFLLDCVRFFNPDLLHTSQFCYGALPISIPKLVVAHSDVLSWWRSCRSSPPDNSEWLTTYLRLVCDGLRGADMVIAPTRWMLRQLDRDYGPFLASTVIANGRDIGDLPPRPRRLQAVTAGRLWDEAKNVALLSQVTTKVPMLVAGDDSFEGATVTRPQRDHVRFLGRLAEDDLLRLLSESAIYIVTSRYEPFGLAAVEAALAGCAIVANDIASLREVWGDAAIYFRHNNPESLSQILDGLAANPTGLREAAARAGRRARQSFSRNRMTKGYLNLYSRLLFSQEEKHAA